MSKTRVSVFIGPEDNLHPINLLPWQEPRQQFRQPKDYEFKYSREETERWEFELEKFWCDKFFM